jgi:copper(I)-binding protein
MSIVPSSRLVAATLLAVAAVFSVAALAQSASTIGKLELSGGWARAMLPGQPTGGAYLTIVNRGSDADRLVGVASPAAGKVEIHSMTMENDVMVMRPLADGLEIPAGATVTLEPSGLHLMFMDVREPFQAGGSVPVTLDFAKAGRLELSLPVQTSAAGGHDAHGG